jgi:hypothetical protein
MRPRFLLPASALAIVLGLFILWPGGAGRPQAVSAGLCPLSVEEGGGAEVVTLVIDFRAGSVAGPLALHWGFNVTVTPDPLIETHDGFYFAADNGLNDDDNDLPILGQITIDDACQTDHPDFFARSYTFVAGITPGSPAALQGCVIQNPELFGLTFMGGPEIYGFVTFIVSC